MWVFFGPLDQESVPNDRVLDVPRYGSWKMVEAKSINAITAISASLVSALSIKSGWQMTGFTAGRRNRSSAGYRKFILCVE